MAKKEIGKQSVEFDCPPLIAGAASVVGEHPVEKPEESRLTATGRSDKSDNRLFLNLHTDTLQCMKISIPKVHIARIYFHCIHILI